MGISCSFNWSCHLNEISTLLRFFILPKYFCEVLDAPTWICIMVLPFAKDLCVLLVDADPSSSKKTLEVLLDAKYRVVTVGRGDEALSIIKRKKRKVDLVLISPSLPDICTFKLVGMLNSEYGLPVVMICDCNLTTVLRSLNNGAIICLEKPLCMEQAEKFWQYAFGKITDAEADYWITGFTAMMGNCLQESASSSNGVSSEVRKRKITDLEIDEDWFVGLPASFNWTNVLQLKSPENVGSGIDVVESSEVLRHIGCPGLTIEYVNEKLQQYHLGLARQQDQVFEKVLPFPDQTPITDFPQNPQDLNTTVFQPQANPPDGQEMGLLPTTLLGSDLSSALLPSTPQSSPGPVLPADIEQSSVQAPDSSAIEAPEVIIALSGTGEKEAEHDY